MKYLILTILLCSSLGFGQSSDKKPQLKPGTLQGNGGPGVIAQTPVTHDGNGGPGAGDALRSSEDDVRSMLSLVRNFLPGLLAEAQRELKQSGDVLRISDPVVRGIFSKMLGNATDVKKSPVMEDLARTKFLQQHEPVCDFIFKENKDAATLRHELGADICFNVPKLRRVPKEALGKQIAALVMHELSHHFQSDELSAKHFQEFITYKLYSDCGMQIILKSGDRTDRGIEIYPKRWNNMSPIENQTPPYSASVRVVNGAHYAHRLPVNPDPYSRDDFSDVEFSTFNSPSEFSMSIDKSGGQSRIKFYNLNADSTRTPIEVSWTSLPFNGYSTFVSTSIKGSGLVNGQPIEAEIVTVGDSCFYR